MSALSGKVALVTGASRGIGRAIALSLAEAGADLVLTSTSLKGADEVLRRVLEMKRRAIAVKCDARSPSDVDAVVEATHKLFGRVDILVNNAGVVQRAPITEMSDADFDRVLAVNLAGPFYFIRRLAPRMAEQGGGRIINISSISSTLGTPRLSSYCASKWGLNGLTKSLAEELKPARVFVAAVLPGSVDTEMLKGSGYAPSMAPEDVAPVVRFLCAEAPFQMTGSLVEVFG